MAMFQFSARQVELNFCDQIKCTVPLTDEVQKKVQDAAKELLRVSQAAKDSDNKEHTLDDLCDSVMDAIDEILGEGMSEPDSRHEGRLYLLGRLRRVQVYHRRDQHRNARRGCVLRVQAPDHAGQSRAASRKA